MINRELREVSAMRRRISDLEKSVATAKKGGLTVQARKLEEEVNALKRSVKDYDDRTDPQGKQRKG